MGEADGQNVLAIAESLTVGFAMADADGWRVEYANPAFEKWFPAPPGEDTIVARLAGLDPERARKRIAKGRAYVLETEVKSGARAIALRTTLREVDQDGRPLLVVETADVSKHKEVEHMLDSFSKLADRNKIQLEKANLALTQKTEELKEAYDLIKAQKDRMERELQVARQVQENMMPTGLVPGHDECTVAATLKPALEVGGDFFDFFYVDNDRLCFLVGDVSDKGAASGLFMAAAKTLLKTEATRAVSTAGIMSRVNRELSANNDACMFVTVFVAILDLKTGAVVFTNAGHDPPYLVRRSQPPELISQRHGLPLGVGDESEYTEAALVLEPEDLVVVYSDGVTDATNREREAFGRERMETLLADDEFRAPESAVRGIAEAVEVWEEGTPQTDDVTIVGLKFHGSK
jgi:serine phosphatase RsbU (regulator of sigma subunit)